MAGREALRNVLVQGTLTSTPLSNKTLWRTTRLSLRGL